MRKGVVCNASGWNSKRDNKARKRNKYTKHKWGVCCGCLLWIVPIAENQEELQEMLNIPENIANKYHIVFGEEKRKTMHIKTRKVYPPNKLGEIKLMHTDKYKYLGQVMN